MQIYKRINNIAKPFFAFALKNKNAPCEYVFFVHK